MELHHNTQDFEEAIDVFEILTSALPLQNDTVFSCHPEEA